MERNTVDIEMAKVIAGDNDRKDFKDSSLVELAAQIKRAGLLQPITLRRASGRKGVYEIVAGERRFRAVKSLGWKTIPAQIIDLSDEEASAMMLAENMARADLNPIEEAEAYQKRIDRFGWSVEQCAEGAGVSQVRVHFRLKLLRLLPDIRFLIQSGNFPMGYAQILADAALDAGFQMLALKKYRDNPTPTPSWFRNLVCEFKDKQSQGEMFDAPLFNGVANSAENILTPTLPPDPVIDQAPMSGNSLRDKLHSQISFWETAAEDWNRLGKPFKRQECQAAVSVLRSTLVGVEI